MSDTTATIPITDQIPILLAFTKNGQPITPPPLTWSQSPVIGDIAPTSDPNVFTFIPTKTGTTQISCSWQN